MVSSGTERRSRVPPGAGPPGELPRLTWETGSEAERLDTVLAATFRNPYLFGSQTYARARIAAVLGDRSESRGLLRAPAWVPGPTAGLR